MKKNLFLLLFFLLSASTYAQTSEKFNYNLSESATQYWISLKSQQPISKDAKSILGHITDGQWFRSVYDSIIYKSISSDKLQKFKRRTGGVIAITYAITGKVLKVKLGISKEDIHVLNENDLSILFDNLYKFDMDMSKVRIEDPKNSRQKTEVFWSYFFPLKNVRIK